MGKHYDALRKKCPCQYCQAIFADNHWGTEHLPCLTPSPMQAYEEAMEQLVALQSLESYRPDHKPERKEKQEKRGRPKGTVRSQQYVDAYLSGMTLQEVADKFTITRQGVSLALLRAGVSPRTVSKTRTLEDRDYRQENKKETAEYWRKIYRQRLKEAGYRRCALCKEYDLPERADKDSRPMVYHGKFHSVHRTCNSENTRRRYARKVGKEFIPRDATCPCGKPACHYGKCAYKGKRTKGPSSPRYDLYKTLEAKGRLPEQIAKLMKISIGSVHNYKWRLSKESKLEEPKVGNCTRQPHHDGPCNGWPVETCKGFRGDTTS